MVLLDREANVVSAEPGALPLLREAYGEAGLVASAVPPRLAAALQEIGVDSPSTTILVGDVLLHGALLNGRELFYVVSVEPIARRDQLSRSSKLYGLTRREGEVLSLILRGDRANDIARELGISPTTVSDHFTNLLRKTESRNRSEMLAKLMLS